MNNPQAALIAASGQCSTHVATLELANAYLEWLDANDPIQREHRVRLQALEQRLQDKEAGLI